MLRAMFTTNARAQHLLAVPCVQPQKITLRSHSGTPSLRLAPKLRRPSRPMTITSAAAPLSNPASEQSSFSFGQIGSGFAKLVLQAIHLVKMLVKSLQRLRLAAAAVQQASASTPSSATTSPAPAARTQPEQTPLQVFSAVTMPAVEHLRQTLTDATGTLEAKWRALEGTAAHNTNGLFSATRDSAEALNKLQPSDGQATRQWNINSTATVVQEEEALRQQVFAQVYAELNAKARRGDHLGFSAA